MILALLMLFSAFSACDSTEQESSTETQGASETESTLVTNTEAETETEYFPNVAENNYDAEFYLSVQPDSNYLEYHWVIRILK